MRCGECVFLAEWSGDRIRHRVVVGVVKPTRVQAWDALERERLCAENKALRSALRFYAKPRSYGTGEFAIFLDDCGHARRVLDELGIER